MYGVCSPDRLRITIITIKNTIMEKYNYLESLKEDVKGFIQENGHLYETGCRDNFENRLNDDLFTEDSVTGNGSGSYTFNSAAAEEYICGNLDLLAEACEEFGSFDVLKKGAEACDVAVRCHLLSQAICEVLDEMEEYA